MTDAYHLRNQRLEVVFERAKDLLRDGEIEDGFVHSKEHIERLNEAVCRVVELEEPPLVISTPRTEPDFIAEEIERRTRHDQVVMPGFDVVPSPETVITPDHRCTCDPKLPTYPLGKHQPRCPTRLRTDEGG